MQQKGFTLAETLITLAIVGVVAALTLPSLIQDYHKKQWVAGLKNVMSILTQGSQKAMADDDVTDFIETELYRTCKLSQYGTNIEEWNNKCSAMLTKYFKGSSITNYNEIYAELDATEDQIIDNVELCKDLVAKGHRWWLLSDQNKKCTGYIDVPFYLTNGMMIDFFATTFPDRPFYLTVDINGSQKPNTWGRDVFLIMINRHGVAIPDSGYQDHWARAKYRSNSDNPSDTASTQSQINIMYYCSEQSKGSKYNGCSCAARIQADGWKMNY